MKIFFADKLDSFRAENVSIYELKFSVHLAYRSHNPDCLERSCQSKINLLRKSDTVTI